MRSAGEVLWLALAPCLLATAGCFAPSLPLLALRRPVFAHAGVRRLKFMVGHTQGNLFAQTRMTGTNAAAATASILKHFYILVKDPVDTNLDLDTDPYRIQSVKADANFNLLFTELQSRVSSAESADQRLCHLADMPVAVEFADVCSGEEKNRVFALPGNITSLRLRERTFGQSGVGGSLWVAGIGLSIWLALHRDTHLAGKTVLELGSGVGLTGMTCALAGSAATTLSDFGQVTGTSATQVVYPSPPPTQAEKMWKGVAQKSAIFGEGGATAEGVALDLDKQTDFGEGLRRRKQQAIICAAIARAVAADEQGAAEKEEDEEDYSEFNLPVAGGGSGGGGSGGSAGEIVGATSMDYQPKELLQNLAYAIKLNDLEDVCQLAHLDWHSSLHPSFVPQQQYDVVVGSDLIYYTTDAAALAATIIAHTAPTGVAYLMCQRGRRGLVDLLRFLRAKGEVEEDEYTLVELVNKDAQLPPLLLVTYRPFDLMTATALVVKDVLRSSR